MKKLIAIIIMTAMFLSVGPSVAFAISTDDQTAATEAEATVETETSVEDVTPLSLDEEVGAEAEEPPADSEEPEEPPVEPLNGWVTDENGNTLYYINDQFVTGFNDIDGATYYFNTEGYRQTGMLTINGAVYYFNASMKTGWQTYKGKTYYFGSNGVRWKGLKTIGGSKYYLNPDRKTGIIKIGSRVYYFQSSGKAYMKKGWIRNKTRYANGNGTLANSVKKIGTKYYLFKSSNGLKVTKQGFCSQGGKTYYVKSNASLATGWRAIDDKAYFFYKSGKSACAQAKGTTIGYLKIPKKGYLGEAYALGIKKLNKTDWTLKQAYKNSYKIKYQGRWWRQKTAEKYALKGFKKNKGNCYVMASTFYIQAKLLGYNIRQIEGKVNGSHPHSWTQIKHGDKWYVYDPNFRNETGRNGWKIWYGKKGTWKYRKYHVFQN